MSAGTQRSTPSSVVVGVSFYGIIFFSAVLIIGAARFVISWRSQRRVLPRPAAVLPVEATAVQALPVEATAVLPVEAIISYPDAPYR